MEDFATGRVVALALCGVALVAAGPGGADETDPAIEAPARVESAHPFGEPLSLPANRIELDRAVLERHRGRSLPEVLSIEAGLDVINGTTTPWDFDVGLRGLYLGYDRTSNVAFLIDGVPVNDAGLGEPTWTALDLDQIERIEVIRGAPDAELADVGLAGSVLIWTRAADGTPGLELTELIGAYDDFTTSAFARGFTDRAGGTLFARWRRSDSFRDGGDFQGGRIAGSLRLEPGDGWTFDLAGGYLRDDWNDPGLLPPRDLVAGRRDARAAALVRHPIDSHRYWLRARAELALSDRVSLSVTPFHRRRESDSVETVLVEIQELDPFEGPLEHCIPPDCPSLSDLLVLPGLGELVPTPVSDRLDERSTASGLLFRLVVTGTVGGRPHELRAGLDYLHETVRAEGETTTVLSLGGPPRTLPERRTYRRDRAGLFVQESIRLGDRLRASAGVRADWHRIRVGPVGLLGLLFGDDTPERQREVVLSPNASLAYRLSPGLELFASFHRAARSPVADEAVLFPGLPRSTTYELGLKLTRPRLTGVVAGYSSVLRDDPRRALAGAFDRTRHQGLEVLLHAHPTEWLELRAGYQLDAVRAHHRRVVLIGDLPVQLSEVDLEQSPRHRGRLAVWVRPAWWLELGLLGELAGRRSVVAETSSYAQLDAELRARPPVFDALDFEVFVRALNLFDREYEYEAFTSEAAAGFPRVGALTAPDRRFAAGVVLTF